MANLRTQQIQRVRKSPDFSLFVFVFKNQQIQNGTFFPSISGGKCQKSAKTYCNTELKETDTSCMGFL